MQTLSKVSTASMWKIPDFIPDDDFTDNPLILLLLLASVLQTSVSYSLDTRPCLTNQDIVTLLDRGIPEGLVLEVIDATENNFDLSRLHVINLMRHGVSDKLIDAMVRAKSFQSVH
jgi:hypothetical protein